MIMMSVCTLIWAVLLLASQAMAAHYYGGSMSFSPKRNANGTYRVDIRFKEAYSGCDPNDYWYCGSGNCGNKTSYASGQIDSSRYGGSWCQTEAVMTRIVSSNSPFQLQKSSCCWISNVITGSGNWRLLTLIDLGTRSDTQQPNRSPVATTLPIVRVPQNCPRNYNLLSCDPDYDQVRCRYGNLASDECGMCSQHAGFALNENLCTVSYNYTSRGVYVFELVMEDYPTQNISLTYSSNVLTSRSPFVPLGKIPLQFAVEVGAPVPSCVEGEYLPRFIHPTPLHGEHLEARVNQELEIRVKAFATFSNIVGVVISGPLNSTKEVTTTGEYVISWTPNAGNLGEHFPFCFIAEALNGSVTYQSEMRCVIVVVKPAGPKADVICTKDTISVTIEKATIFNIHEDQLRLNNASHSCPVSYNTTHVFTNSLTDCGTQIEETDEHLIFTNEIVTFDNPADIITRKHEMGIEIMCKYQKRSSITTMFNAHRPAINISEKGFGSFSYQFEFYNSDFRSRKSPSLYPLEYSVGQTIYMQISPASVVQNTEVFVESCSAAPYDNPNYPISYPIIANGCEVDDTVQFMTTHESNVKFSMEAFKFIGQYDQVFITCSIIICQANNPNTRCAQGCTNVTAAPSLSRLHKRDASFQTANHFISQGPLRLKRSLSYTEFIPSPSLNLNLVFIAGCLLAVVAMVCGVVVYRSRSSKVNYQRLNSDEI